MKITNLFLCTVVACGMAATASAGLIGQSIQADYLYPDTSTVAGSGAMGTLTVSPTATFNSFDQEQWVVSDTQINVTNVGGLTYSPQPGAFNGVRFTEVGASPVTITGVTIDAATNLAGFTAADVTFDATHIFINQVHASGLPPNMLIRLNVTTSAASTVPEPATLSFMGLGLALTAALKLRKSRS